MGLLSLFGVAIAADVEKIFDTEGRQGALLSGKISSGDTQRVAKFFLKFPSIEALYLDSRGGDVIEAIRLGELVRTLRILVHVADRGVCASACFFIWINGESRMAVPEEYKKSSGPVGLHRPFLVNPEDNETSLKKQSNVISGVRRYLEDNFIPRRLIDTMMSRPSNDIYWLTTDDLEEIGFVPPALEELYIAKCHANIRQLSANRSEAALRNDAPALARIDARLNEIFKCTSELDFDAHSAALKKLASGWLPPVPFK